MQTQFTVVFDACVLYPAPVRDLLLQLASNGLYRAKWTKRIQEEWTRNLLKNRSDISKSQLDRTCVLMNDSILDCLVTDYEELAAGITLPDQDDVHVLAAAIKAQAQVIVTCNLKDFPKDSLQKFDLESQHPDTFFRHQMDLNLSVFLSCVKTIRLRLKKPPRTPNEYLCVLLEHLPQTVSILKRYENLI